MSTTLTPDNLVKAIVFLPMHGTLESKHKIITRIPGGYQIDNLILDPRQIGIKHISTSIFVPYTAVQEDPEVLAMMNILTVEP